MQEGNGVQQATGKEGGQHSVLMVTPKFPPQPGGAAYVFSRHAEGLAKNGHAVAVLTSTVGGRPRIERHGKVRVYRLFPYYPNPLHKVLFLPLSMLLVLAFYIAEGRRYRIIESHTVGELCLLSQIAARLLGKPLVKHVIDLQTPQCLLRWPAPSLVLCCGETVKDRARDAGVRPDRVSVLPLPFERPSIGPPKQQDRKRVFIFIGEISQKKGVGDLLAVLRDWQAPCTFIFVGDGPLLPAVQAYASSDARVVATGRLDHEATVAMLQRSDVLVHPSYADVLPLSILDAMAAGNAVIASDVGEIKRVVGKGGWIITPGNRQQLKAALESAMRKSLGKKRRDALRNIERYGGQDIYEQHHVLLEALLH